MRNEYIEDNVLWSNTIGETFDLIRSSNLIILKCYKGVFKKENIVKSHGGYIIIGIVFFQLIFSLIFGFYDMNMIRKFLQNLTEYFMVSVTNKNNININPNRSRGIKKIKRKKEEKDLKEKKKEKKVFLLMKKIPKV